MVTRLFVDRADGRGLQPLGQVTGLEVRFLVKTGDSLRQVCKMLMLRKDFSFALMPYSRGGQYFYQLNEFVPTELGKIIELPDPTDFESIPKLMIHESGTVHISAGRKRVGSAVVPPLYEWSGDHIATVDVDRFANLPEYTGDLKRNSSVLDQPVQFADGVEAGRLVFCVNAGSPRFTQACTLMYQVLNEATKKSIYIGVAFRDHPARSGHADGGGVLVLGGWNPSYNLDEPISLLVLRGL